MAGHTVQSLERRIASLNGTNQSIKTAMKDQESIIERYEKMVRDIEGGFSHGTYTIEGLKHGIEQAEKHKAQLAMARHKNREEIKQCMMMIDTIKIADDLKNQPVVVPPDGKLELTLPTDAWNK